MKILIFGGTGFLGRNLVLRLLKDEHMIGMYVRSKSINTEFLTKIHDKVNLHIGEFMNEYDFEQVVRDYDVVYHLISSTVPGIVNPIQDIDATIKPSLRLLDACVKMKTKHLIFFSSGGTVYGIPKSIPLNENDIGQPLSSYGIQKQIMEKYLLFYQYAFGLPISILRISNPYGRYQRPFSNQGIIANMLGKYLTGKSVEIFGDGDVIRDYIYVDDVIDAAVKILSYNGTNSIFNIGSGIGYSVNEIINVLNDVLGNRLQIKRCPSRKLDVPINVLDIQLVKEELNWVPKVELREGMRKMLKYWNDENKNFDGVISCN